MDMPPEDTSELLQRVVVDSAGVTLYRVCAPGAAANADPPELSALLEAHFKRAVTIETTAIALSGQPSRTLH
jgi:hypothetical protein